MLSMKNHGADDAVNAMFDMGAEVMALPLEEKMKYEQCDVNDWPITTSSRPSIPC